MSSLLLIVTGASRGFGQSVANAFLQHAPVTRVCALLVARSRHGLEETQEQMQLAAQKNNISLENSLHVMDLSHLETLDENIDKLLQDISEATTNNDYDRVVLVNNSGSLGYLGPLTEMKSLKELQENLDFNVTSSMWLSIRLVKKLMMQSSATTVINVSSLCAMEPFPTMATYCTGKAAREMFYKVWSKELADNNNNVKLLNYAPGPMQTEMACQLQTADKLDPKIQDFYKTGDLVSPNKSAKRMVKLVWNNDFESGSHVDYFDLSDDE